MEKEPSKSCIICGEVKTLSDFYPHKQMRDGHLNKCKTCTKRHTKNRVKRLGTDPEFLRKERERSRKKYHRLGYKEKHKLSPEEKAIEMAKYNSQYPEKRKAKTAAGKHVIVDNGIERHHWSYNPEHYIDIIPLSRKIHASVHRFLSYDREAMMYRRLDNNDLLDTKEKHQSYIDILIATNFRE